MTIVRSTIVVLCIIIIIVIDIGTASDLDPAVPVILIHYASFFFLPLVFGFEFGEDLLGFVEDTRCRRTTCVAFWRLDEPVDGASGKKNVSIWL